MQIVEQRKENLIEEFLRMKVLSFGERTLKSGRVSPYFFNIGRADTALNMSSLARSYAPLIYRDVDIIAGPAYKGIVLSYAVALEFSKMFGRDVGWTYNRKEEKKGEGRWVGSEFENGFGISLLDDVITDGATKYEFVDMIKEVADVDFKELVIAFNRQEVDANGNDAVAQFKVKTGIEVKSILTAGDLYDYTLERKMNRERDALIHYSQLYGTREFQGRVVSNFFYS